MPLFFANSASVLFFGQYINNNCLSANIVVFVLYFFKQICFLLAKQSVIWKATYTIFVSSHSFLTWYITGCLWFYFPFLTYYSCAPPEIVAFAESVDHVSEVVQLCNNAEVPLIPFGSGTGLEGGVNAIKVGITRADYGS